MDRLTEKKEIDECYKKLSVNADKLYRFVMLYNDYIHASHNYGTAEKISMVEVHILTIVEDNPGITMSELAAVWGRTASAVSQSVTKIEKKGLVVRKRSEQNGKNILLYPTPAGIELSTAHKKYDCRDIADTRRLLLEHSTPEELDTFYKVLGHYIDLF